MTRAPVLSRRLVLEAAVVADDGGGGKVETWTALGVHWADVRAVLASERFAGGAETSRVTHRVILRWVPPESPGRPSAAHRFRDGARIFAILGVSEAEPRNRFLVAWVGEEAGR